MIKAIIFDFDGVIIESADIKTEAFKEIFHDYPQKIEAIVNYHLLHAGRSRYVKFRYIYEHILGQKFLKEEEVELGKRFSQIVMEKVLAAPFVVGSREFFDKNKSRYHFFVVSGTPEEELHNIVFAKGLQGYFKQIHGSPEEKADIITSIIQKYGLGRNEVVYIGDAETDRIAAKKAGIAFIERRANFDRKSKSNSWIIKDLVDLDKILQELNRITYKIRKEA